MLSSIRGQTFFPEFNRLHGTSKYTKKWHIPLEVSFIQFSTNMDFHVTDSLNGIYLNSSEQRSRLSPCYLLSKKIYNDTFMDWKYEAVPKYSNSQQHFGIMESKSFVDFNITPSMTLVPLYWRKVLYDYCHNFCFWKISCG